MSLLEKSRKINSMLQKVSGPVNFREMAETLRDVIGANVYVLSRRGKLLGLAISQEIDNEKMKKIYEERQFPQDYTEKLFTITETTANIDINSELTAFPVENKELFKNGLTTIVPIVGGGQRLGTLILSRFDKEFSEEELVLAEYGATVVGMEILHEKAEEIEEEARNKAVVQMAISSL